MSSVLSISPGLATGAAVDEAILEGPAVELHVVPSEPVETHLEWKKELELAAARLKRRHVRVSQSMLAGELKTTLSSVYRRCKTLKAEGLWPSDVPQRKPGCNKNDREVSTGLRELRKRIEATIDTLMDGGIEVTREALADHLSINLHTFRNKLKQLRKGGLWPESLPRRETTPEGKAEKYRRYLLGWRKKLEIEAGKLAISGKIISIATLAKAMQKSEAEIAFKLSTLRKNNLWPEGVPKRAQGEHAQKPPRPKDDGTIFGGIYESPTLDWKAWVQSYKDAIVELTRKKRAITYESLAEVLNYPSWRAVRYEVAQLMALSWAPAGLNSSLLFPPQT